MTYPNTSDFTIATDDGAWWLIRVTNADGSQSVIVCSTNGRAFVNQVQSIIGTGVDGQWGTATSTALLNALRAAGADANVISGIQAEATIHRPGIWSTAGAVWLIHHIQAIGNAPAGIAFSAINIPDNTVFPVWNIASQLGPGGSISPTCTVIPSDATQLPTQVQMPDQTQIQVNPMTSTPAPVDNTASQIIADSLSNTIGIGMWVVAGVVVLVAGAFVLAQMNPTALPMLAPANAATSRMRSSRTRSVR